jgi:hypothetical protein
VTTSRHARDAALTELRRLVAVLEHRETGPAPDEPEERAHDLRELVVSWLTLWLTPVACVATLLTFIWWPRAAGFAVASAQVVAALVLRSLRLAHPWWRRWLYGVGLGLLLALLS